MVKNLSQRLLAVNSQFKCVDERTERSVRFLEKVDQIKYRIEHCAKLISEVQNWKYRLKSIDILFGSREFSRIAAEIQDMENCVQMLIKVPEYDRRLAELNELRGRLETICSPHLLAAIQSGDRDLIQSFSMIFDKIDRQQIVVQIYLSSRTDWLSQLDSNYHTDDRLSDIQHWLSDYLSEVTAMLRAESQSLSDLFPDINHNDLVLHAVSVIKRKLVIWLENITSSNTNAIDVIVSVLGIVTTFLLESSDLDCVSSSAETQQQIWSLFASVFIPFSGKLYLELESRRLTSASGQLRNLLHVNTEYRTAISSIEKSLDCLFEICRESLCRCQSFGNGLNMKSFQLAIDSFINDLIERLLLCLRHIRKLAGHDSIESDASEWASIEIAFRLVRFARTMRLQLAAFDAESITSISNLLSVLFRDSDRTADFTIRFYQMLIPQQKSAMEFLLTFTEPNLCSAERVLFLQSRSSAQKLEKAIRTFAFDTMLKDIRGLLRGFSTWPCWNQCNQEISSLLSQPSDYITRIGDQLFGFVPEIEAQLNFDSILTESGDDMLTWLRQLSFATVDDILSQIVNLPALSDSGSRQLATDLEYLANILSALGIEIPSSLKTTEKCLLMSPHEVSAMHLDSRSDQNRVEQIASIRQMSSGT